MIAAKELKVNQFGIMANAPEPFSARIVMRAEKGLLILSTLSRPGIRLLWPNVKVFVIGKVVDRLNDRTIDDMKVGEYALYRFGFALIEKRKEGLYKISLNYENGIKLDVNGDEKVDIIQVNHD